MTLFLHHSFSHWHLSLAMVYYLDILDYCNHDHCKAGSIMKLLFTISSLLPFEHLTQQYQL